MNLDAERLARLVPGVLDELARRMGGRAPLSDSTGEATGGVSDFGERFLAWSWVGRRTVERFGVETTLDEAMDVVILGTVNEPEMGEHVEQVRALMRTQDLGDGDKIDERLAGFDSPSEQLPAMKLVVMAVEELVRRAALAGRTDEMTVIAQLMEEAGRRGWEPPGRVEARRRPNEKGTTMADSQDVIAILLQDHQEVRQLFTRIASGTGKAKEDAFHELVFELARHETAEEEVVYPVLRREGDAGESVAKARIKEEEDANKLLAELEKTEIGSASFEEKFEKLRTAVLAHAEAEEADVFPRLRQSCDAAKLNSMGRVLEMAKKTAPTHPHPNVPGTATANLVAGPIAAIVDRTRDAIRKASEKLAS